MREHLHRLGTPLPYMPIALIVMSPKGLSTASRASLPVRPRAGLRALALRRFAAAVGDRHHHRDQRDAVADAVVGCARSSRCRRRSARSGGTATADGADRAARGEARRRAPAGLAHRLPGRGSSTSRTTWRSMSKCSSSTQLAPTASCTTRWRKRSYFEQFVRDALAQRRVRDARAAASRRRRSSSG